ncbi:MAG: hypothetical protein A3I02_11525 [Betaproteobacteria bacterium RIFCSPLOWO2_02_FULL_67_26]|nr:MAG: hypothetical protein A3I02_11525 [Betaproteobacteria bacterium RIFCSPLOWO2_02_FULL_67_26]
MRRLALLWLLASIAMLAVMLLRPGIHENERSALAVLVPLYFLALPFGHLGVMASNKLKLSLVLEFNIVPGILAEGLVLWTALVVLGYAQWFIVLPWVSRKCLQLSRFLFKRDPAR